MYRCIGGHGCVRCARGLICGEQSFFSQPVGGFGDHGFGRQNLSVHATGKNERVLSGIGEVGAVGSQLPDELVSAGAQRTVEIPDQAAAELPDEQHPQQ